MLSKSHPVILFLDRNGFSVYQDVLTNIPRFNFTPDLISNMDVVNREQFGNLIATFIQINKMFPSNLAVILSDDVIYLKDLASSAQKSAPGQGSKTDLDDKDQKGEVQNFLEDIPFEEVLAKVIKSGNADRVVAVNKDLVMAIIDAFAGKGFNAEAIAPGFMFGQNVNFTQGLTLDNVRTILGNVEALRLCNLLTNQEKLAPSQNLESELKIQPAETVKKPQSLRQYILIGVFATLLVILAVVYLNMGVSQAPPKSPKVKSASVSNTVSVNPLAPTSTQALITPAPVDLKNIKIKIVQSSQADGRAVNLKSGLLGIGFQDIVSEISGSAATEKSSVIFSQTIPADLRNNVIVEINKILPEISVLESQDSVSTISIIVGKT